mmetsp:Transcript_206/g.375  ORF Transcript_206/g.375 Transcript_206/m.375 type:complete len:265 (-) Transcript_206:145-939(-)
MWWLGQLFLDSLIVCSDLSLLGTFLAIFLKLQTSRSSAGLSLQTLITVVSARTLHLVSHFVRLHYQPTVVPWALFPVIDVINAGLGILCIVMFTLFYYKSYEKEKDNFGIQAIERLGILHQGVPQLQRNVIAMGLMYVGIAIIALLWYFVRRSHHSFALSYFCCYYEVLCAVALFPQLWMFHQDKRVQPLLANFVVLTAMSRVCTLCFWITYPWVYHWSYPDNRGIQMASETLNILILSDFLYYWLRAKLRGQSEVTLGDNMLV